MTDRQSPTEALLPCPFCGKADNLIRRHMEGTTVHPTYCIECDYCGARNGWTDKGDEAAAWNRRAHPQQPSGWRDIALDTARLRELLEKATPGKWMAIGSAGYVQSGPGHPKQTILAVAYGHDGNHQFNAPGSRENGEYIAACNPEAIRALIDELDMLRAIHRAHPAEQQEVGDAGDFDDEAHDRDNYLSAQGDELDAAMYRWLRDQNDWYAEPRIDEEDGTVWKLTFYTPARIEDPTDDDNLDTAIRAAMTGGSN